MKYPDFIKSFLSGKIAPVYFFYGGEGYLIDEGVGKIEKKIVTKNTASFNRDVFYGEDTDAARIVNTALSVPMLAARRLVIVKNFHRLSQSGKELLLKYSQKPSPQAVMVLISGSADFRKKIYAGLQKTAEVVECRTLYDNQVPIYIQQYAENKGKKIHPRAIQLLQAKMGNSLQTLISETEKLIHFVQDKKEIMQEDVEELVGISREYNVFQLWDSLGQKNLVKSLFILDQMLESGESAVYLVTSLTNYFLRLWRIRALKKRKTSDFDIGKLLHIHQFFVKPSIQQARNYSDWEIRMALKHLLNADIQLKSSYQKPKFILELTVFQILQNRQAA